MFFLLGTWQYPAIPGGTWQYPVLSLIFHLQGVTGGGGGGWMFLGHFELQGEGMTLSPSKTGKTTCRRLQL